MKRHKAPQIEMPLFSSGQEPFALNREATLDGAKIEQAQVERQAHQEHARTLQRDIPGIKGTFHTYE